MKNFILILLIASVLFTAPDVGATANPPPVKRELKALTKAKTQTVQKNETKAPDDPGWQLMRQ